MMKMVFAGISVKVATLIVSATGVSKGVEREKQTDKQQNDKTSQQDSSFQR